jgi:hypothetical protein
MPVPSSINDLSPLPGSNYPAGSESPATIDDYLRSHAAFIAQQRDAVRPVALGGTGAITAAAARAALGVVDAIYPVGSIYINATNAANPATLLGVGTWVAFGAGRVPVGFNSGDALFNAAEKTGGSKDAIVVSHSHSLTDPGHSHTTTLGLDQASGLGFQKYLPGIGQNIQSSSSTTGISVNSTGSSGTNANLQPFITVYMWKRTA